MKNRSKGIALSYVNSGLSMICGLFLSSYLLRMLGDTEYGVYQTVSAFANYLVLFEFGTGTVMTRNLSMCFGKKASREEIDKNVSTIWTITNILAVFILIVSVVFYCLIGVIYTKSLTVEQIAYSRKIFVFITFYLFFSFYTQTMNGVVLACEKYTFSSSVSVIKLIVRTLLLTALIFLFKYSIVIAIVDMCLSLIIACYEYLYCIKKCNIKFTMKYFDKQIFKNALPLCMAIFMQTIVNQANNNVDKFVIGIMLTPELVALYSVGMYVFSSFSSFTTIPISMYAPQIVKNVAGGMRGKELTKTLIEPSRLITLIGGSILFGFVAAGKQFITIVYGKSYIQAYIIAVLVMVPMFMNMSNGVIINILDAMNKRIYRSNVLLLTTIANIILTVILIKNHGIVGAAFATAICTFVGQVIIMNIYYSKNIGISVMYLFKETYKGMLLYQLVASVVAYFVGQAINNVYLSFVASIVLYLLIFGVAFVVDKRNKNELKQIFSMVKRKND